jgi:hypothetical protein
MLFTKLRRGWEEEMCWQRFESEFHRCNLKRLWPLNVPNSPWRFYSQNHLTLRSYRIHSILRALKKEFPLVLFSNTQLFFTPFKKACCLWFGPSAVMNDPERHQKSSLVSIILKMLDASEGDSFFPSKKYFHGSIFLLSLISYRNLFIFP